MALTKIPANLLDKSAHVDFADNEQIRIGNDQDLLIHHDGTNNLIQGSANKVLYIQGRAGVNSILAVPDGAVNIYHNNSLKLETTAAGATVTGTLTVTGDLDITGNVNSASVTDLDVTDKTITLGVGQTEAQSGGSGIVIDGSNASMLWDETNGEFDFNNPLSIVNSIGGDTVLNLTGSYGSGNNVALLGFARSGGAVSGDIRYVDATTDMEIGTGTAHAFSLKTSGTRRLYIASDGKVGIGTTSLYNPLTVSGADSIAIDDYIIHNGDSNTKFGFSADDTIVFRTGGNERLRIASDGNIGLNDTNPDRKVSIIGDSTSNGQYALSLDATNTDYTLEFRRNGTSEWWIAQSSSAFRIHENGVGDHFRINAGGDVDVKAGNLYLTGSVDRRIKLSDSGTTGVSTSDNAVYIRGNDDTLILNAAGNGLTKFQYNGTERMRIDTSGNVLVGTTTFNNLSTESGLLASNNVVMARGGLADHQDACAVLQYTSDAAWLRAYGDTAGSGYMVFRTGGGAGSGDTERMRLTHQGDLLIGSTTFQHGSFGGNSRGINVAGIQPILLFHETDTDKDGYLGISGSNMFVGSADNIGIRFHTNDTERMRVLGSGGLTFNGDTAQANALDDYEEGSFTPSMTGFTGTTVAAAQYTKVGRLVSIDLRLRWTGSDATTNLMKFSLPFTSASPGDAARTGIVFYSGTAVHSGATISCHLGNGSSELTFYRSDGGGFSSVLRSHVNGTYDWLVSFSYFTS